MPTSEDLKSEDFFLFGLAPPNRIRQCDPPENFFFELDALPPPPLSPTEEFRGKNVDLSVKDFSWLNTHLIRLSLI